MEVRVDTGEGRKITERETQLRIESRSEIFVFLAVPKPEKQLLGISYTGGYPGNTNTKGGLQTDLSLFSFCSLSLSLSLFLLLNGFIQSLSFFFLGEGVRSEKNKR